MKFKAEVLKLSSNGDMGFVEAQCEHSGANWLPMSKLTFEVPIYRIRNYMIGQTLDVTITPRTRRRKPAGGSE